MERTVDEGGLVWLGGGVGGEVIERVAAKNDVCLCETRPSRSRKISVITYQFIIIIYVCLFQCGSTNV